MICFYGIWKLLQITVISKHSKAVLRKVENIHSQYRSATTFQYERHTKTMGRKTNDMNQVTCELTFKEATAECRRTQLFKQMYRVISWLL